MQAGARVRGNHSGEVVASSHLGPAVVEVTHLRAARTEADGGAPQAAAASVMLVGGHGHVEVSVSVGGRVMAKQLPSWVCEDVTC